MENMKIKKVVILAGGTGGHIFPALEVAKKLRENGYYVHWIGTKLGLESSIVPKNNFPISYITIDGIRGKSLSKLIFILSVVVSQMISPFSEYKAILYFRTFGILDQIRLIISFFLSTCSFSGYWSKNLR